MINLTQSTKVPSSLHTIPCNPAKSWVSESIAIDAPADSDIDPDPNAWWPADSVRTGLCGAVSPRIIALQQGGYRMYYTQILPRSGFPMGANDYDNATSRILSATSCDGITWNPEPGVRLTPHDGGAGNFRVVSSEVVPQFDSSNSRLRMYYECCAGPQSQANSIRSAVSNDGLVWTVEPGTRFELSQQNVSAPRILLLNDGRCRLFCSEQDLGIISAISKDGGFTFEQESGIRVAPNTRFDCTTAFAPEIMRLKDGSYRMYYAGYSKPQRADILTATSQDGLDWHKADEPVLSPGSRPWDATKCSEMCIIWNPRSGEGSQDFRMFYEACDGTAPDQRGVWRIACATCR